MPTTTKDEAARTPGPGDLLYRNDWETKRAIPHEEAREIAARLIASHFRRTDCETARASIPANPDRDDDLLINAYIKQQARKDASAPASPGVPDSLRALSEKASKGPWRLEPATPGFRAPAENDAADMMIVAADSLVPGVMWDAGYIDAQRANIEFTVAAVNHVRTLSATHPAGQSAESGADTLAATLAEFQRRNGYHRREIEELLTEFGELLLLSKVQPAPDSTRTGDEGTDELRAAMIRALDGHTTYSRDCHLSGDYLCAQIWPLVEAALAARPAAPEAQGAEISQAARDVLAERRRQVEAEGWTPAHDDGHSLGELGLAAALYALPYDARVGGEPLIEQDHHIGLDMALEIACGWRLKPDTDPRRRLVKSGALILAEIERRDRLPAPPASSGQEGR